MGPKSKSCSVVFDGRRIGHWGKIAKLNPSHSPASTLSVPPLLSSPRRYWYTRNAYEDKSAYKMHIELTPVICEPRPRSWKYVRRSLAHLNRTWRPYVDLSIPTLAALVVMRSRKSALRIWPSSQKRRIRQNLSVLCSEALMWIMSMLSFISLSFRSRWSRKCCDCLRELQKTTALFVGFAHMNSAIIVKPLETNWPLREQM